MNALSSRLASLAICLSCLFTAACEVRKADPRDSPKAPPAETTKAAQSPPEARALSPEEEAARAKKEVEAASVDFLQNGLAGIWDGRVDEERKLARWFLPGEESERYQKRIFADQSSRDSRLLSARVSSVTLEPTLDKATAAFLIQVKDTSRVQCFSGSYSWVLQESGVWLRTSIATLQPSSECP